MSTEYLKKSVDYTINMQALYEMEEIVPMTIRERNALHDWAKKGHDIESNPWDAIDEYGYPLNFLRAFRLKLGYSSGPWDLWRGPEDELYWDGKCNKFHLPDEY